MPVLPVHLSGSASAVVYGGTSSCIAILCARRARRTLRELLARGEPSGRPAACPAPPFPPTCRSPIGGSIGAAARRPAHVALPVVRATVPTGMPSGGQRVGRTPCTLAHRRPRGPI